MLICLFLFGKSMLYPVGFFGSLGVVETVEGSNKIACYTADPLKRLVAEMICAVYVFTVNVHVDRCDIAVGIFLQSCFGVVVDLLLWESSAGNIDFH